MRWPATLPQKGDVRTRWVFAWLPTVVQGHRVWLEHYYVREKRCDDFWHVQESWLHENAPPARSDYD